MKEVVFEKLAIEGYSARLLGIEFLKTIEDEYKRLIKSSVVDFSLAERYLSDFSFEPPAEMPEASSIIAVAVPRPVYEVKFNFKEKNISGIIPPIYTHYYKTYFKVLELLIEAGIQYGYKFIKANLPEKFLASHCGLLSYGRNNIGYVPGLGSYFQLVSFYSNMESGDSSYNDPVILERCKRCSACIKVCPTGAIDKERFVIHAEKCITFLNENPGEILEEIIPSSHNTLIGCMICQKICPENKNIKLQIENGGEFSEEEIHLLLTSCQPEELPGNLLERLNELDLVGSHIGYREFKRNLLSLLNKQYTFLYPSPGEEE